MIVEFSRGEDAQYRDWVRLNSDGYVLKHRGRPGYMLHLAGCGHLGLYGKFTLASTPPSRPRLCSTSKQLLEDRSRSETGEPPVPCSTCWA